MEGMAEIMITFELTLEKKRGGGGVRCNFYPHILIRFLSELLLGKRLSELNGELHIL